jgi:hypothetical protein
MRVRLRQIFRRWGDKDGDNMRGNAELAAVRSVRERDRNKVTGNCEISSICIIYIFGYTRIHIDCCGN